MEYLGHQGDVKFIRVEEFSKGEIIRDEQTKKGILAFGEATGHAHQIVEADLPHVDFFKIRQPDGTETLGLYVKAPIRIDHSKERGWKGEEPDQDYHSPAFLEPGKYEAGIVQQFDPFLKVNERVVD